MSIDIADEIYAAEEAAAQAELLEARMREAWRMVMATDAGRTVVRSMIEFLAPLAGSALDHASLAYREGQRSVSLHITNAVRAYAPEHFPTLFEDKQ